MTAPQTPASDTAQLFLTEGTSDKEYRLELFATKAGWEVMARYGRRGGALKEHKKTPMPVPFPVARKEYDKALASKLKEGYTAEVSGVAPPLVPDFGLLKNDHQVMTKDDCHDFRTPDLGWVHGQPDDFAEAVLSNFASEFWIGPSSDARAFAEQMTAQYAAWAPTISSPSCFAQDSGTCNASEIAVAYWENVELGMSMVAVLPYYDTYMWNHETQVDERALNVPAVDAFPAMRMLGFDGNDNCAAELVSSLCDEVSAGSISEDEGRNIARFLLTVTIREYQEEVRNGLDDEFPTWKAKKKAPKLA